MPDKAAAAAAAQAAFVMQVRAKTLEAQVNIINKTPCHLVTEVHKELYGVCTSKPNPIPRKGKGTGGEWKTYPDAEIPLILGLVAYSTPDPDCYMVLHFDVSPSEENATKVFFFNRTYHPVTSIDEALVLRIANSDKTGPHAVHTFNYRGSGALLELSSNITSGHKAVATYELSLRDGGVAIPNPPDIPLTNLVPDIPPPSLVPDIPPTNLVPEVPPTNAS